jgi:hypothetical protein
MNQKIGGFMTDAGYKNEHKSAFQTAGKFQSSRG